MPRRGHDGRQNTVDRARQAADLCTPHARYDIALTAAHALTPLLTEDEPPSFPFLTLLVSGGHTMLVLVHALDRFQILADTLDDSVGYVAGLTEAIPLTSLRGPWASAGSMHLARWSRHWQRGMIRARPVRCRVFRASCLAHPLFLSTSTSSRSSGLRSSSTRAIELAGGADRMSTEAQAALAYEFQCAAFAPLEDKIMRAVSLHTHKGWHLGVSSDVSPSVIKGVVASGGVASNQFLRARLRHALDACGRGDVRLHFPPVSLCVDNAAMVAWAGHLFWDQRTTDLAPHVVARWPLS